MQHSRQPALFIPHGGGPCFFMDDPRGIWRGMEAYLQSIAATLPARPRAILVVSGHWETEGFAFTGAERPALVYDYYNFPPYTYELRYDAPGDPALAARASALLRGAGLPATIDAERGLDHGVFIPLKVAFPTRRYRSSKCRSISASIPRFTSRRAARSHPCAMRACSSSARA